MRAAVGQLTSTVNLTKNGQAAARLIKRAAEAGCQALFLPEASDYIAGSPAETVSLAQPIESSPFFAEVRRALAQSPLYVSVGVHEPTEPPSQRVRNTLLWVGPQGEILQRYQKVHLFDVDVPNGPILRESKSVEPGTKRAELIELDGLKLGPQICYDVRFPETALDLRARGAHIVLYPSAFTVKTGKAHWLALNRARAIDTQSYVISAAQVGKHDAEGRRQSWGHSIVIDPWGEVVAESLADGEDLLVVDIDTALLDAVRVNMPLWDQRKNADGALSGDGYVVLE